MASSHWDVLREERDAHFQSLDKKGKSTTSHSDVRRSQSPAMWIKNAWDVAVDRVDAFSERKLGLDVVKQAGKRFQMRIIIYSTQHAKRCLEWHPKPCVTTAPHA